MNARHALVLGGARSGKTAFAERLAMRSGDAGVPDAVVVLLKLYEAEKTEGETPAAFFERLDGKRVVAALGELVTASPKAEEASDIGEDKGFLVELGEGECAA